MASNPVDELPSIFRINSEFGVLLCQLHGAYTRSSYKRHLLELHNIKGESLKRYSQMIEKAGLKESRDQVNRPINERSPIEGLEIKIGYGCLQCNLLTVNENLMKAHRRSHRNPDPTQSAYQTDVHFQTLWNQQPQYFRVSLPPTDPDPLPEAGSILIPNRTLDTLKVQYDDSQKARKRKYQHLNEPVHVSENTPWLKCSGFAEHLKGVDLAELRPSYALPDEDDEPRLAKIMKHVERVLKNSMKTLQHENPDGPTFSRLHKRIINTFRRAETNQDLMQSLQNGKSLDKYTRTWQEALCYYCRVESGQRLREDLFRGTPQQNESLQAIYDEMADQERGTPYPEDEDWVEEQALALDRLVLAWSLSFIRQKLQFRSFDSPIVSFLAAKAWDVKLGIFPASPFWG